MQRREIAILYRLATVEIEVADSQADIERMLVAADS